MDGWISQLCTEMMGKQRPVKQPGCFIVSSYMVNVLVLKPNFIYCTEAALGADNSGS